MILRSIAASLILLLSFSANASFYIYNYQIFQEGEHAYVTYYDYSYEGKSKSPLYLRLFKVETEEGVKKAIESQNSDLFPEEVFKKHSKLIRDWPFDTDKSKNYYSSQIDLGELEHGYYILEAFRGHQIVHCPVIVTNSVITVNRLKNDLGIFLADGESGKSRAGYTAHVFVDGEWHSKKNAQRGIARFPGLSAQSNSYAEFPVFAWMNGNVAFSQSYINYYYQGSGFKYQVSTNAPAYRPGQWAVLKGYARISEGYSLDIPEDSVQVLIYDPQYNEVYKKWLPLDRVGAFSDSIKIGEEFKLGSYEVQLNHSSGYNYNSYYGSDNYSFEVQEYKKPEYEVLVAFSSESFMAGETIEATIEANYFFGAPVKDAEVEYQWYRQANYPQYYNYDYWWYSFYYAPYYQTNSEIIEYGSAQIGEDGKVDVSLKLPGDLNQNYSYSLRAEVTDAARRTITGSGSTEVLYTSLQLVAFADKQYYKLGDSAQILVQTSSTDGSPVQTEVKLEFTGPQKSVKTVQTSKVSGNAELDFLVEKAGYYSVKAMAKDKNGVEVSSNLSFYVFDEKSRYSDYYKSQTHSPTIILQSKAVEAGDELKFMLAIPESRDVYVQVFGQEIIHQEVIPARSGVREYLLEMSIPVPSRIYGSLTVDVGYVKDYSFSHSSESVQIINPANQLSVNLEFDKESYQAGETARATIKVLDHEGNPVPNAQVNLSTIDNSLLFLYPDNSTDPHQAFYGESGSGEKGSISTNSASFYRYSTSIPPRKFRELMDSYLIENTSPILDEGAIQLGQSYESDDLGSISGFVYDDYGHPATEAVIRIGNRKFNVDDFGYFEIKGFDNSVKTDILIEQGNASLKITDLNLASTFGIHAYINLPAKGQVELRAEDYIYFWDEIVMDAVELEENGVENLQAVTIATGVSGGRGKSMSDRKVAAKADMTFAAEAPDVNGYSMDDPGQQGNLAATNVRSNFRDAAFYLDAGYTDENGEIKITIPFPDNLTTWNTRATVITDDTKVGQVNVKTLVTKDLLVRLEAPRFMTVGDQAILATTVHNYLPREKDVKVSLTAGGLSGDFEPIWITVPANGEVRLDWEVSADWVTTAKVAVKAETDELSDAQIQSFPVQAHGLENVEVLTEFLKDRERGRLIFNTPRADDFESTQATLTLSPSLSSGLLSSLEDLIGYPYGCVEQTMSRFLPNVVVAGVLKDIEGAGANIDQNELAKMVDQGFKRLAELQHSDGGWGWWTNDDTHPFMTAYVCYGLVLAEQNGYSVPPSLKTNGLANLESQIKNQSAKDPATYAYQMMVAMLAGLDLWQEPKKKPEEMGTYELSLWIQAAALAGKDNKAQVWSQALINQSIQEGSWVYWGDKKFYYSWQEDRVETTANAIKALVMANMNSEEIYKATQWIMDQRKGKSWHNTRQTAMTVYALSELIQKEINSKTEVVIYANGSEIHRLEVDGKEALSGGTVLKLYPESYLASNDDKASGKLNVLTEGQNEIIIQQEGSGVLYASLRLSYFSSSIERIEKSESFKVERTWYSLSPQKRNNEVVYDRVKIKSGNQIPSGTLMLAEVKLQVNSSDQQYVLVEDFIPAGCEFVQDMQGYNVTGIGNLENFAQSSSNNGWYGYYNHWYTHQEYRDNRMAITVTSLPKGDYTYYYLIRTQLPGEYEINPTVAQLMYYPEIRGFSDFTELIITDRN